MRKQIKQIILDNIAKQSDTHKIMENMNKIMEIMDNILKQTLPIHEKLDKDKLDKSPIINILWKPLTTYIILHKINLENRQDKP
jgi:BarA-like signal transduction histidine kinase